MRERERGHPAGADDHDGAALETLERGGGQRGAEGDVGIRRRTDRGLLPHAATGARRGVEQARQVGAGSVLAVGSPQRLAHLRLDLRLTEYQRVEPRRDREQVIGGVALPVRVQRLGQFLRGDTARLDQEALQRQEPRVIGRHASVHLDPVAGGQDHDLVELLEVAGAPVRLREVFVAERQSIQQVDGRTTERDAEAQDAHPVVIVAGHDGRPSRDLN